MKNQPSSVWSRLKHWLADTGKQLAIAIFIVMFLRSSIIEPYKIPSGSMIPTLFIGDHIFVNKFSYGFKVPFTEFFLDKPIYLTTQQTPARGDVIVFRYPRDESINYIKRVVGLPGDRIAIREKVLFINDEPIQIENLKDPALEAGIENDDDRRVLTLFTERLDGTVHPVLYNMRSLLNSDYGPVEVPDGHIFTLGDNRDKSSDSRVWGFVPMDNIKGKAMFVWLNFVFRMENEFSLQFRAERIGTSIR
jgi:signal peptidase I